MNYYSKWSEEETDHLLHLIDTHPEQNNFTYAEMLEQKFNRKFSFDTVRKKRKRMDSQVVEQKTTVEEIRYTEKHEIHKDGSHSSDKLVTMSENESKSVDYLLQAHGFSLTEWELISARNNIYNTNDKIKGIQTLYSSKISVKPKETSLDFNKLIAAIEKSKPAKAIKFVGYVPEEKTYLHLPLYDLHFGTSTIEYYENTLRSIVQLLEKSYTEVLIIIGQDMLHNDNFRGQTASGTLIDKVDMTKAWDDADLFYTTIIEKAIEKSPKVTVIFSKGNHDESMSWAFAKGFEKAYRQQATFDTRFRERKAHMLGTNFLGLTHGDKNRKNIASNFSIEFPVMWAQATSREVHVGHLHRKRTTQQPIELISDEKGVIVREMGSGCDTDQWHDDMGYTMAHKEFEIFEYTESKKKRIHYV